MMHTRQLAIAGGYLKKVSVRKSRFGVKWGSNIGLEGSKIGLRGHCLSLSKSGLHKDLQKWVVNPYLSKRPISPYNPKNHDEKYLRVRLNKNSQKIWS